MKNNLPLRVIGWIFFIVSGLSLGVILFLGRDTVLTLTLLLTRNAYLPRFLDKVYLVVVGVIWLLMWLYFEGYYSRAAEKRRLWPSILRVTGAELILLFLLTSLPMFFTSTGVDWFKVALVTLALAVGVLMVLVSTRLLSQRDSTNT